MTGREKVIKGLECCRIQQNEVPPICEACPYADEACGTCEDMSGLLNDAYEMLKAQQPRVMTLEEVKQFVFGAPYIIETNEPDNESRMMYGLYSHQGLEGNFDFAVTDMRKRLFDIDYGKTWRCWTSIPTDDQREAEKWDDA